MSESIMQKFKCCYVCGRQYDLSRHHIYAGPNRKWSEQYGLWLWLCGPCHTGTRGAQYEKELNLRLKREGQEAFEKIYDRKKFMEIFGKNYL